MLKSQAHERNIVSFVSNLLNSLVIVVYVRKNVIAFYGSIFPSCTSVPHLKKMSSRFKTCFKVPMKRNFFSHIFEIYRLKYTIPKFETFRVKINDLESYISKICEKRFRFIGTLKRCDNP